MQTIIFFLPILQCFLFLILGTLFVITSIFRSGVANSDQVQTTWEVISSDRLDSETDIDDLEQINSASCQLLVLAVAEMI